MANRADPEGAVQSGSALFAQVYLSLFRVNMVLSN